MDRRLKVIIFFLVVFALPICWYLFLQFFGRNNFTLDVLGKYSVESCEVEGPVLLTRDDLISKFPNQFARVSKHLNELRSISFYGIDVSCMKGFDMLLIDGEQQIRGEYLANREDVDRMLAEVDIFVMNLKQGVENERE